MALLRSLVAGLWFTALAGGCGAAAPHSAGAGNRVPPVPPPAPTIGDPDTPAAARCSEYTFVYEDLDRFAEALDAIDGGADPHATMRRYFAEGSPGLKTWVRIYNNDAKRFGRLVQTRPNYFRSLVAKRAQFEAAAPAIACGYDELRKLAPDVLDEKLPTYMFITGLGGGGSVRPAGVLLAVDYFGYDDDIDRSEFPEGIIPDGRLSLVPPSALTHTAVHEMVHYVQRKTQGLMPYSKMYRIRSRRTMLAYAIREGGADFVASLATSEQPPRNAFARQNETLLWTEFSQALDGEPDDHPGWFSGRDPGHPRRPFQIGYAMGYLIVEAYYAAATNKRQALRTIFSASKPAEFRAILEPYRTKAG